MYCLFAVINQEKTIQNIEDFDKNKLKHTETDEKNPLPDKDSEHNDSRYIVLLSSTSILWRHLAN